MEVKINTDERAAFVGTTGSGKTVLANYLLGYAGERVLVLDPKHTFIREDYKERRNLPFLKSKFKMIYRPQDDDHMVKLLHEVNDRGNVRIYVDELATLSGTFPKSTAVLENISRTGRERHISLWGATQRPRHVPRSFFTESEVWFVFLLRDLQDRRHLRDMVGAQAEDRIPLYHFWYVRSGMEEPQLMTLDLDSNQLMEVVNNGREIAG